MHCSSCVCAHLFSSSFWLGLLLCRGEERERERDAGDAKKDYKVGRRSPDILLLVRWKKKERAAAAQQQQQTQQRPHLMQQQQQQQQCRQSLPGPEERPRAHISSVVHALIVTICNNTTHTATTAAAFTGNLCLLQFASNINGRCRDISNNISLALSVPLGERREREEREEELCGRSKKQAY